MTGDVVLDAGDVGAIPNVYGSPDGSTRIPYYLANTGQQGVVIMDVNATSGAVVKRQASGAILVPTTPTTSTQAASKGYVDAQIAAAVANAVMSDGTVTDIVAKTQAEYDALTPDATTHYLIDG